jgi:hypothetical protein
MSFTATVWSNSPSTRVALYTAPIPPRPISSSSRYAPTVLPIILLSELLSGRSIYRCEENAGCASKNILSPAGKLVKLLCFVKFGYESLKARFAMQVREPGVRLHQIEAVGAGRLRAFQPLKGFLSIAEMVI